MYALNIVAIFRGHLKSFIIFLIFNWYILKIQFTLPYSSGRSTQNKKIPDQTEAIIHTLIFFFFC